MCLVETLRHIQLYEADFSFSQQVIFGKEVMNALTDTVFLPKKHFSKTDITIDNANVDKTFPEDLSR